MAARGGGGTSGIRPDLGGQHFTGGWMSCGERCGVDGRRGDVSKEERGGPAEGRIFLFFLIAAK